MMTTFDAILEMRMIRLAASGASIEQVNHMRSTVAWVRATCERDGHPAWLVDAVVANVERALLADDFPLVEGNE